MKPEVAFDILNTDILALIADKLDIATYKALRLTTNTTALLTRKHFVHSRAQIRPYHINLDDQISWEKSASILNSLRDEHFGPAAKMLNITRLNLGS